MQWQVVLAAASAARQAGHSDRALELARSAQGVAPAEAAPVFLLCALLLERQSPEANALLGTLERFPDFAPGWEDIGHVLAARHPAGARVAFERAAQAYATAEAATPGAGPALGLGRILRRLGDLPGARRALQRATQHDPALPQAWFGLGLLCQDLADLPAAAQAFRAAIAVRPDFHEAAFNLAVALQEAGDLSAALDAYAQAWRLRPDSFGRIAQALVSPAVGRLWLHPSALQHELAARHITAQA